METLYLLPKTLRRIRLSKTEKSRASTMAKDLKLQYRFKIHNILKLTEGYLLGEILA